MGLILIYIKTALNYHTLIYYKAHFKAPLNFHKALKGPWLN